MLTIVYTPFTSLVKYSLTPRITSATVPPASHFRPNPSCIAPPSLLSATPSTNFFAFFPLGTFASRKTLRSSWSIPVHKCACVCVVCVCVCVVCVYVCVGGVWCVRNGIPDTLRYTSLLHRVVHISYLLTQ